MKSESILLALGKCYRILYDKNSLRNNINKVLSLLGEATEVDRVYIFKNHYSQGGDFSMSQVFEWVKGNITPQLDFEVLQDLSWSYFPELLEALQENQPVHDFVENSTNKLFQETMQEQGILSFLFVPIFSGNRFWGYIGFDNCSKDELFKPEQVAALHAFAGNFGNEIHIRRQRKVIREKRGKFLSFIQSMDKIIFRLSPKGEVDFINTAWEKLTGVKGKEVYKNGLFNYLHKEGNGQFIEFLKSTGSQHSKFASEVQILNSEGQYKWYIIRVNKLYSKQGEFIGYSGSIEDVHDQKISQIRINKMTEFLQVINEVQLGYFENVGFKEPLDHLLHALLRITESQFGFIGEAFMDENGLPYLKTHSISNIAWSEETEAYYKANYSSGMEFRNLDTLFGEVLKTSEVVISNHVASDPRAKGTPPGHPPLVRFLGIPVLKNDELIGMMGFANKETDYTSEDVAFLDPIVSSYANFIKSLRFVRERKKVEDEIKNAKEMYDLIAQNTEDIIAVHDLDLTFRYVSPSIQRILGYSPAEIIGKKPWEALSYVKKVNFQNIFVSKKGLVEYYHKNGRKKVSLEILRQMMYDDKGNPVSIVATSRDVTEREKILQDLKKSLAKEKDLNQLKSRFISMISHEFRTPLSTMLSSTELLNVYCNIIHENELKSKVKLHLERINSQIYRLSGIISDILIFEKGSKKNLLPFKEKIKINEFMTNLIFSNFTDTEGRSKVNLKLLPAEREVISDNKWLVHIFRNLIENAIKYSEKSRQKPEVKIELADNSFSISVEDFGLGIPEEDQPYIFDSFFRGKNVANIKGTGLGLNIVNEFVEKLSGKISFTSTYGKGSLFKVELPYES